jgi:hypothetical protein
MTFKPAIWYPISVVLSVINVGAAWFAAQSAEPWHAMTHATLAVAFGIWARHLRQGPVRSELQDPRGSELRAGLEALEVEVNALRQELSETQERVDFVERLLAKQPEPRRVEPTR